MAFADGDLISKQYRVEDGTIALYKISADGRRQIIGFAFVIVDRGGVPRAVQAIKNGAVDFIQKHVDHDQLLARTERAPDQTQDSVVLGGGLSTATTCVASLTTRQREILDFVLTGCPSKIIAINLGISQRTVDNHRAAIMRKTGCKSIAALVRKALAAT